MADWDVYADDSSTSKPNRYMVLGGVMLPTGSAEKLRESITRWRNGERLLDEIAWTKLTRGKLIRYKTFARGAMHYINHGDMTFGCARFDRFDKRLFPGVDDATARDKQAYQFFLRCFLMKVAREDRVFIYPDQDLIRGSVADMTRILNAGLAMETGWRGVNVLRSIQPQKSHLCHFVQMSDIFTGAVAAMNNGGHDIASNRGAAKQSLAEYIEELSGVSLKTGMSANQRKFNVWFFEPNERMASVSPTTATVPRVQTGYSTPP